MKVNGIFFILLATLDTLAMSTLFAYEAVRQSNIIKKQKTARAQTWTNGALRLYGP